MKQLFKLEKFAFVDEDGLIYTSTGTQDNIDDYRFDYRTISEPEISILNLESPDKKVIIAVPVHMSFQGKELLVCFMEIDMAEMLSGVSMQSQEDSATFCNIYTSGRRRAQRHGARRSRRRRQSAGGHENADFEEGYSYEQFADDFPRATGRGLLHLQRHPGNAELCARGGDRLAADLPDPRERHQRADQRHLGGIIRRSVLQSVLTVLVMLSCSPHHRQIARNARLLLEKETAEAENRVKQEELEQRLSCRRSCWSRAEGSRSSRTG